VVHRFNSWSVVGRPGQVLDAVVSVLGTSRSGWTVAALGLGLWVLYEILAMCLEGIAMRWLRWAEPPPPDFP
jgi:hypothetical protein